MITPKKRKIVLMVAGVLLLTALLWNFAINKTSHAQRLASYLNNTYGYHLFGDDIYIAAQWQDASIRSLFPDTNMDYAVEASKKAGLPSDIDKTGQVHLVLANTLNDGIITLYLLNGQIELGFVQKENQDAITVLGDF